MSFWFTIQTNYKEQKLFTDRKQILATFFFIVAFIILLMGIEKQLKERKNQYICKGYLRHWRTAFELYQKENNLAKQKFSWDKKEEWIEYIIQNYFFEKNAVSCPATLSQKDQKNYRINSSHFIHSFPRNDFILSSKKVVFVLDACSSSFRFIVSENPSQEVDYRHLGGANVLWSDGSVSHQKFDTKMAWKEECPEKK